MILIFLERKHFFYYFGFTTKKKKKLKENEKKDKNLELAWELKNMEHEGDSDINCNWCTWNNP